MNLSDLAAAFGAAHQEMAGFWPGGWEGTAIVPVGEARGADLDLLRRAASPTPTPAVWNCDAAALRAVYDSVNRIVSIFELDREHGELAISPETWRRLGLPVDVKYLFGMAVDKYDYIEDGRAAIYDGALWYTDTPTGLA